MSFWRGFGKVIDWVGLRLLVLVAVGITAFAVLQPLIWRQFLHKPPPAGSADLASLTGIVVTIMTLVLAIFGVVAYQLVARRSETRLERRAESLQQDLQAGSADAIAKLYIHLSYQAYESYDELWENHHYQRDSLGSIPELKASLDRAIGNAKAAYDELRKLPRTLRERRNVAENIRICIGNYTYFLATRGHKNDEKQVLRMAKELDKPELAGNKLETVAWAYLRYSQPGEPRWKTGLQRLAALMDGEMAEDRKKKLISRYEGVFAKDGQLLDGVKDALEGRPPS